MFHALAGPVGLSDVSSSPLDTDDILSALGLTEHEFAAQITSNMKIRDGRILDAWGNPIRLTILNNEACLISFGRNRMPDAAKQDDIVRCFNISFTQKRKGGRKN